MPKQAEANVVIVVEDGVVTSIFADSPITYRVIDMDALPIGENPILRAFPSDHVSPTPQEDAVKMLKLEEEWEEFLDNLVD